MSLQKMEVPMGDLPMVSCIQEVSKNNYMINITGDFNYTQSEMELWDFRNSVKVLLEKKNAKVSTIKLDFLEIFNEDKFSGATSTLIAEVICASEDLVKKFAKVKILIDSSSEMLLIMNMTGALPKLKSIGCEITCVARK